MAQISIKERININRLFIIANILTIPLVTYP